MEFHILGTATLVGLSAIPFSQNNISPKLLLMTNRKLCAILIGMASRSMTLDDLELQ